MREEEEMVGGGCRTRQMSEHAVRKLQIFGPGDGSLENLKHLRAPVLTARERELQK